MTATADPDAEFAAWVATEVRTWPRFTDAARTRLAILLDLTLSATDVVARLRALPALLSERDHTATVSDRGSQPPDNHSEVQS